VRTKALRISALILFVGTSLGLQIYWLENGHVPPQQDSPGYIWNTLTLYQDLFLTEGSWLQKLPFSIEPHYPHWEYFVTFPFYLLQGVSLKSVSFSLLPWSLIFLLSMYGCGKALCGEKGGWLLLLGAAASPAYAIFSKFYVQEVPITAVTALALYFLVSSNYFEKTFPSILLGLSLGLSLMFKGSGILYIAAVLLVVYLQHVVLSARPWFWKVILLMLFLLSPLIAKGIVGSQTFIVLQRASSEKFLKFSLLFGLLMASLVLLVSLLRRVLRNDSLSRAWNFLAALLMALAVMFPWYVAHWGAVGEKIDEHQGTMPCNLAEISMYLSDFEDMLYLAKILVIVGIVLLLSSRRSIGKYLPFIAGSAVSFYVMCLTHPHTTKYLLPFLPCVLIIGLLWTIEPAVHKSIRPPGWMAAPIVAVLLLQMIGWLMYPSFPGLGKVFRRVNITGIRFPIPSPRWYHKYCLKDFKIPTQWEPVRESFGIVEVLEAIEAGEGATGPPKVIMLYSHFGGPFLLEYRHFCLEARLRGINIVIIDLSHPINTSEMGRVDYCVEIDQKCSKDQMERLSNRSLKEFMELRLPWDNTMRIYGIGGNTDNH
jgi:hypothetical protein